MSSHLSLLYVNVDEVRNALSLDDMVRDSVRGTLRALLTVGEDVGGN